MTKRVPPHERVRPREYANEWEQSDRTVTALYDRSECWPQKKHALDAWGQRLMEIVSSEPAATNVVPLASAGEVN